MNGVSTIACRITAMVPSARRNFTPITRGATR
jgi:hypothetical protein